MPSANYIVPEIGKHHPNWLNPYWPGVILTGIKIPFLFQLNEAVDVWFWSVMELDRDTHFKYLPEIKPGLLGV